MIYNIIVRKYENRIVEGGLIRPTNNEWTMNEANRQ